MGSLKAYAAPQGAGLLFQTFLCREVMAIIRPIQGVL
jgi:hypothetical protein